MVTEDILAGQNRIRGPAGIADCGNNGRGAALYIADQEDVGLTGFPIEIDNRPAMFIERNTHRREGIVILLLADGGYQGIDLQRAGLGGCTGRRRPFHRLRRES